MLSIWPRLSPKWVKAEARSWGGQSSLDCAQSISSPNKHKSLLSSAFVAFRRPLLHLFEDFHLSAGQDKTGRQARNKSKARREKNQQKAQKKNRKRKRHLNPFKRIFQALNLRLRYVYLTSNGNGKWWGGKDARWRGCWGKDEGRKSEPGSR